MPKKTKRQKLLADNRRHQSNVSVETSSPVSFQFKATVGSVKPHTPENTQELIAVRNDITKTIILAALAIGAELIVYWKYFAK